MLHNIIVVIYKYSHPIDYIKDMNSKLYYVDGILDPNNISEIAGTHIRGLYDNMLCNWRDLKYNKYYTIYNFVIGDYVHPYLPTKY